MLELGHDPVIHETYRSPERARQLMAKGASKNGDKSIHCYTDEFDRVGAVDVISKSRMWFAPPKGATKAQIKEAREACKKFFGDWHTRATRHGLHVIDWDGPHAQAIPCKPGPQNAYRALTPAARGAWIAQALPLPA
jgi:hypothetical protein